MVLGLAVVLAQVENVGRAVEVGGGVVVGPRVVGEGPQLVVPRGEDPVVPRGEGIIRLYPLPGVVVDAGC